jgi:hypothetical protein
MSTTLGATTLIAAPIAVVWQALCDTERWDQWATFRVVRSDGLQVGRRIDIGFKLAGREISGRAALIEVEPERALWWRGGVWGLLDIRHGFRLSQVDGGTQVVHQEIFSGLLAPLILRLLGAGQADSYTRTNTGLKTFLEGSVSAR